MHDETMTQRFLRRIEVPIDADATYKNDVSAFFDFKLDRGS